MSRYVLQVKTEEAGARVDVYVTRALPDVVPSRMFVKRILDAGRLTVNGKPVKAQYKVGVDDEVVLEAEDTDFVDDSIKPQAMALDILMEDEDIIVLNKPSGLSVHPAAGNYGGTLVNALVHHCKELSDINGSKRPGIVHRLDKDTSGVLLVAKNNFAHTHLAGQFEQHTIDKEYIALVEGEVQFDEGMIEAAIGEHHKYHDMRRIVPDGEGKSAQTFYRVMARTPKMSLVVLRPRTGRTHQLRLHMRHIGHAVLGDDKYGNKSLFPRLALHARSIAFTHPRSGERMEFAVPIPHEFLQMMRL